MFQLKHELKFRNHFRFKIQDSFKIHKKWIIEEFLTKLIILFLEKKEKRIKK